MDWGKGRFWMSAVLCAGGLILNSSAADLETLSGRKYKNYEIKKITDRAVEIAHDAGFSSIPFDELPKKFLQENSEVEEKMNEIRARKLAAEKAEKEKQEQEHKQQLREIERRAYEQTKREQFLKSLFLSPPPETVGKKNEKADILRNILFIEGDSGSGTGFKMRFGRENVIVSNAHVYLAINNPKIRDVSGNEYKIEQVISSKERDLVILKYRPFPGETAVLKMAPAITSIPMNSSIVAYGNSQGDNVNVTLPGNLLGIGYDVIEINSEIVGGNSGGPVVLQGSGNVIGVSTYLKTRTITTQTAGTARFGSNHSRNPYVTRRFATRIDNLKMEELEVLSNADLKSDRECMEQINEVVDKISEMAFSNDENALPSLQTYLEETGPFIQKADAHRWTSTYLFKEYKKKREIVQHGLKILGVEDLMLASRLNSIWKRANVKVRNVSVPAQKKECSKCQGAGQVRSSPFGLSIRKGDSFKRAYETCPSCGGAGSTTTAEGATRQEYSISSSALQEFNQCIQKSKRSFNGFTLGGYASEELRRFSYYDQSKFVGKDIDQLAEIYTYQGNHRINEAIKTHFVFIFGRLLRVTIVLPDTSRSRQFFEKYVKDNFSNLDDVYDVNCGVFGSYLLLLCEHDAMAPLHRLTTVTSSDGKDVL